MTAVLLAATASAAAQEPAPPPAPAPKAPDWLDRVTVGGKAYLHYVFDLEHDDDLNAFDVTRAYLQVKAETSDHTRFALALDAPKRVSDVKSVEVETDPVTGEVTGVTVTKSSGPYDVVLKHAYGEIFDLPTKGLWVKFGMHDLPWVPYEEKVWSYRFQGTVMPDREGYLSSTDLGIAIGYDLPSKYLAASVHLINGETWSSPETSEHKDVHAKVTIRPVPSHELLGGLSVSGLAVIGKWTEGDDQDRRRFLGQVAFEHKLGTIAAAFLATSDPPSRLVSKQPSLAGSTETLAKGMGFTVFGWLDAGAVGGPKGLRVMARLDRWDPDGDVDDNSHTREIAGVGYKLNKFVELLADVELVQYDEGALVDDEGKLFLHSEWKY